MRVLGGRARKKSLESPTAAAKVVPLEGQSLREGAPGGGGKVKGEGFNLQKGDEFKVLTLSSKKVCLCDKLYPALPTRSTPPVWTSLGHLSLTGRKRWHVLKGLGVFGKQSLKLQVRHKASTSQGFFLLNALVKSFSFLFPTKSEKNKVFFHKQKSTNPLATFTFP